MALDDFTFRPEFVPLLELADYVKIDYALTNREERKVLLNQLKPYTVALVAEKIETQEEYKLACSEGFTLFQGYFFCGGIAAKSQSPGQPPLPPGNHPSAAKPNAQLPPVEQSGQARCRADLPLTAACQLADVRDAPGSQIH